MTGVALPGGAAGFVEDDEGNAYAVGIGVVVVPHVPVIREAGGLVPGGGVVGALPQAFVRAVEVMGAIVDHVGAVGIDRHALAQSASPAVAVDLDSADVRASQVRPPSVERRIAAVL